MIHTQFKVLLYIVIMILSNASFGQDSPSTQTNNSLNTRKKLHALGMEVLGKGWGITLNYEYKFHPRFSGGLGYGADFGLTDFDRIGIGYGIYRIGKNKHFITSAGVTLGKYPWAKPLKFSTIGNVGFGYEKEGGFGYFRVMPYAIIGAYDDYPLLPSIGFSFGIKI